jgi:hypothetical protein
MFDTDVGQLVKLRPIGNRRLPGTNRPQDDIPAHVAEKQNTCELF